MQENPREDAMLVHVGEIAGVEGVTIVHQPPRNGGISNCSRRQLRRAISSQSRNCRSLDKQIRTSVSRFLSHSIAKPFSGKPGLAFMNASSIAAGATLSGSFRSTYFGGIFTAARALRTVSK